MTNDPFHLDQAPTHLDPKLEHDMRAAAEAEGVDVERTLEIGRRLNTPLGQADLREVLTKAELHIMEARAALEDEHEGKLTRAVDDLAVESFLAHRIVSTW